MYGVIWIIGATGERVCGGRAGERERGGGVERTTLSSKPLDKHSKPLDKHSTPINRQNTQEVRIEVSTRKVYRSKVET